MREGEVISIPDERLLMVRRERPRGSTWNSLDGGIHSILRSKVVKILEYNIE